MAEHEDDVKAELLRLYREVFALRKDQQTLAEKAQENVHLHEEIESLRREILDSQEHEQEADAQVQRLKAKIADLRQSAAADANQITAIGEELERMKQKNASLTSENTALGAKNDTLDRELRQVRDKVAQLEGQLAPIGSRPFPLKRPAQLENPGNPVRQITGNPGGPNLTPGSSARRGTQNATDDTQPEPDDLSDYVPDDSDGGRQRGRKRHRAEAAVGAQVTGKQAITLQDLRAAYPNELAELDAAQALAIGTWRTYRLFVLGSRLLARLNLPSAPGSGLNERFARPLGETGRMVVLSPWDVLVTVGCQQNAGTYANRHVLFTRMRTSYEHFFENAGAQERMKRVTDASVLKILQDLQGFFEGRPSGTWGQWRQNMKIVGGL